MLALSPFHQELLVAASEGRLPTVARELRAYYDQLAWWKWLRRRRVGHQLVTVTLVQDALDIGAFTTLKEYTEYRRRAAALSAGGETPSSARLDAMAARNNALNAILRDRKKPS